MTIDENHRWKIWYCVKGVWADVSREAGIDDWAGERAEMLNRIGAYSSTPILESETSILSLSVYALKLRYFSEEQEKEWQEFKRLYDADLDGYDEILDHWSSDNEDSYWRWFFDAIHPSAYLVFIDYTSETNCVFCQDYMDLLFILSLHSWGLNNNCDE